mgnify:CR=1 FL=1
MWGVTAAVARKAGYSGPMRDMPTDTAKAIYRELYWAPVRADELPAPVRYAVFDAAVNSGPGQAVRWLQRAAGVADDGKLGPVSMAAITAADPEALLRKMLAARLAFNHGVDVATAVTFRSAVTALALGSTGWLLQRALVAMKTCVNEGLKIPYDIMVVGFDDISSAAVAVPKRAASSGAQPRDRAAMKPAQ